MKRHVLSLALLLFMAGGTGLIKAQKSQNYLYEVPSRPWEEVLRKSPGRTANRKTGTSRDSRILNGGVGKDVDNKRFLIIHATTGDTVRNIRRMEVNNEHCRLQFGPVEKEGTYYFYYLPYRVQTGYGFYGGGYLPKESTPDTTWLIQAQTTRRNPQATSGKS